MILTDAEGKFRHGPTERDNYSVEISKEDFIFVRQEDIDNSSEETITTYNFQAQLVARLEIQTLDSADGSPLANVFITFSAGNTILKGQTDSNGELKISGVSPQKYYLTAIKKEYSFSGNYEVFEVHGEEHKYVALSGHRVAFSAYGLVTTLSGQPITQGSAIARCGDNKVEQATLQDNGQFRIMGL